MAPHHRHARGMGIVQFGRILTVELLKPLHTYPHV